MGHPVNGLQYLLDHWNALRNEYSYYAFFLFLHDNPEFAELFNEMLLHWDEISSAGTLFFAIAPPPDGWEAAAGERPYWQHFKANAEEGIDYDDDAVRQVGRYFSVPESTFPGVVLFSDLKRSQTLTIQLAGLSSEETRNYVDNMFLLLNHPVIRRYRQLWRVQPLLDLLPVQEPVTPRWIDAMVDTTWTRSRPPRQPDRVYVQGRQLRPNQRVTLHDPRVPVEETVSSILQELQRLTDEVTQLREEQRSQFARVNLSLERIENVLAETVDRIDRYRAPFVERWLEAEYTVASLEELDAVREDLTRQFDAFILSQSSFLAQRIRASLEIPDELVAYDELLEPNSRAALETSEALWKYLSADPNENSADYAVCGIGLWKALEIELNRTFVDALRIHHTLAEKNTQSVQQLVRRVEQPVKEKGLFRSRYGDVLMNEYVDRNDPTQLKGISLGKVAALLQGISQNKLEQLLHATQAPGVAAGASHSEFLPNVGEQVQVVTVRYRNSHAHLRQMNRATYEAFRALILKDSQSHSPLFRTLDYKRELTNKRLI